MLLFAFFFVCFVCFVVSIPLASLSADCAEDNIRL